MNKIDKDELSKIIELYIVKNYSEAKKRCEKLYLRNKKNLQVNHVLAKIELLNGDTERAIFILKDALKIEINNTGVLLDLGNAYKNNNKLFEAFECYEKITKIIPSDAVAYHNSAEVMAKMENYKLAIDLYSKAYHVNNKHFISLVGIARSYESMHDYEMAKSMYIDILEKSPNNINAMLGLGELYRKLSKYDEGLKLSDIVIKNEPKNTRAYSLRGNIRKDLGCLAAAVEDFNKIIELEPKSALAKNNKAMTLLMMGEYQLGWQLYEARLDINDLRAKKYRSSKPFWNGEKRCTLLIWAEQGIGDEVMFSSMLIDAVKSVDKLIVLIDKRLKNIFERSFESNIIFVTTKEEAELINYDFQIAMGSLGKFFRNKEEDFKRRNDSYLKADPKKIIELKQLIDKKNDEKIIGISWKSKNPRNGLSRGVKVLDFLVNIKLPNVKYVNLQYGDVKEEIDDLYKNSDFKLINVESIDNFKDIDGLAALIMTCDEVISIDNSTVHLAGALGKKTRVMLQRSPDWRWQLVTSDTPWYKSLTLVRDAIL